MTPPVALPRGGDPVETAAFVAHHGGRVVAYLDEVTTPERALRGAGEAFAALRVRLAGSRPDDDAVARALLAATRSAAARHAGRGPSVAGPQDALAPVARLLVALHADRLTPDDATRLDASLRDAAARELAAGFDRAERGYAQGRQAPLTGTEVGVISTSMALAAVPASPAARDAAARRTVVPAPPTGHGPSVAPDPATTPAPPVAPDPPEVPAPPEGPGQPEGPAPPQGPDPPEGPARQPASAPVVPSRSTPPVVLPGGHRTALPPAPLGPEDPVGPESLGYVVPRPGLPRPERLPVPRRRRRRRGTAAPAPSSPAAAPEAPARDDAPTHDDAPLQVPGTAGAGTETGTALAARDPATTETEAPRRPTVARAARGVLESAVVRQLGVPALLLLAVLIAALVAAGAFSPRRDESVPPVPRPTIPTVPGDPRAIPPLP